MSLIPNRAASPAALSLFCVAVFGCASATTQTGSAARTDSDIVATNVLPTDVTASVDTAQISGLSAEVGCASSEARMGYVVLTWNGRALIGSRLLRIDVALEPDGFARGEFVSVNAGSEPAAFRATLARPISPVKARAFDIHLAPPDKAMMVMESAIPARTIRIEHLEPGDYYYARLVTDNGPALAATKLIEFRGPICIADRH
jgi:hypothetical protein